MKALVLKIAAMAVFIGSVCAADQPGGYQIRFGTLQADKGEECPFGKETAILPRKTRDAGFLFGFEITPPDGAAYTYKCILYPPSPLKQLTGDLADAKVAKTGLTVTSPTQKVEGGKLTYPLWFDSDDPLGEWKIEIWVNEKSTKMITFQVIRE